MMSSEVMEPSRDMEGEGEGKAGGGALEGAEDDAKEGRAVVPQPWGGTPKGRGQGREGEISDRPSENPTERQRGPRHGRGWNGQTGRKPYQESAESGETERRKKRENEQSQ